MSSRFVPDEQVEDALIRGIETAWNNYLTYLRLCQEYEEVHTSTVTTRQQAEEVYESAVAFVQREADA